MIRKLFGLVGFQAHLAFERGYVWVSHAKSGPMQGARPGLIVDNGRRGPPWICVGENPSAIIVDNWPGKLWRVAIREAASDRDQRATGTLSVKARSIRAISAFIEAEVHPAELFGPRGQGVCQVLDAASRLKREEAMSLEANRHFGAPAAYDRVWRTWLERQGIVLPANEYCQGLLAMSRLELLSPIGQGLQLIASVMLDRAQQVDGAEATKSDDGETWLIGPWDMAEAALLEAALALGADYTTEEDSVFLLQAWSRVFA